MTNLLAKAKASPMKPKKERRGKWARWMPAIIELLEKGYTVPEIKEFLIEEGEKVPKSFRETLCSMLRYMHDTNIVTIREAKRGRQ